MRVALTVAVVVLDRLAGDLQRGQRTVGVQSGDATSIAYGSAPSSNSVQCKPVTTHDKNYAKDFILFDGFGLRGAGFGLYGDGH